MNTIINRKVVPGVVFGLLIVSLIAGFVMERRQVLSVPILMYHRIGVVEDSPWWVPPDVFEHHMRSLKAQGYTSILPSDLAAHQRWGKPLPRRPLVITFDDGYLNNLTLAEPILKQSGFRAVIYLITDSIADDPAQRRRFEDVECLTWSEIQAAHKRGTFVFGGHGHVHQNLALTDNAFPLIDESRDRIERQGGFRPDSFCYPHGETNERIMEDVRRAGFTSAMVCEDRIAETGPKVNLFVLPRVSVMGGRHRFIASRLHARETTGTIVYQVIHEGIPIEVSVRLCVSGVKDQDQWQAPCEMGPGAQAEHRWVLPASLPKPDTFQVEVWDKHRLFTFPVKIKTQ